MSQWRREAIGRFPERKEWIERARSIHEVFWLLEADVRAALEQAGHPLDSIVDRAFQFAAWCFEPDQHASVRNAAAVSFYEHLPAHDLARREVARRLSPAALRDLMPLFHRMVPEEAYDQLAREVSQVHGPDWAQLPENAT